MSTLSTAKVSEWFAGRSIIIPTMSMATQAFAFDSGRKRSANQYGQRQSADHEHDHDHIRVERNGTHKTLEHRAQQRTPGETLGIAVRGARVGKCGSVTGALLGEGRPG